MTLSAVFRQKKKEKKKKEKDGRSFRLDRLVFFFLHGELMDVFQEASMLRPRRVSLHSYKARPLSAINFFIFGA